MSVQSEEGHYDKGNVDHTCDTVCALMLASEILGDFTTADACIQRGVKWVLDVRNEDDGWSDFSGDESNMLITCDGLDTMLKYARYMRVKEEALAAK